MLWGDSLYDISNSFDAIFRQGQRDEIIKWVVERKEKVTVCVFVGFLLYRKRTYFLVESPKPDGKAKYQEILPVNLTVKGWPLVVANWLVTSGFGRLIGFPGLISHILHIPEFRKLRIDEPVTYFPNQPKFSSPFSIVNPISNNEILLNLVNKGCQGFNYKTAKDYVEAYKGRKSDPVKMATALVQNVKLMNLCLNGISDWSEKMVLEQARESADRWSSGKLLSPLDGVPVVVKDQLFVKGLRTRNGCQNERSPADADSVAIQRLRDAGLIIIGISSMTQRGCSGIGYNPSTHHGTTKNAVDPSFYPGGSSSGTAACVASGLVPFGVGTDGGGSIRIPSSYSGLVGLKPTCGRIPIADTDCNGTLVVTGPMAGSLADTALLYNLMAGQHPSSPVSFNQPAICLTDELFADISGTRVGVDWTWAAQSDQEVFANFKKTVDELEKLGCEIVDISIPELSYADAAHFLIFLSEEAEDARNDEAPCLDNKLILELAELTLSASDHIKASRYRTRLMNFLRQIFENVDVILNPATANTAPKILPGEEIYGSMKVTDTLKAALYTKMGNLAGQPSAVVPNGYDNRGLPTSVMIQSKWWGEEKVLQIARELEALLNRKRPKVLYHNLA